MQVCSLRPENLGGGGERILTVPRTGQRACWGLAKSPITSATITALEHIEKVLSTRPRDIHT